MMLSIRWYLGYLNSYLGAGSEFLHLAQAREPLNFLDLSSACVDRLDRLVDQDKSLRWGPQELPIL